MYQDRAEAAHLLAEQLEKWNEANPVILALPRGGVPMGKIIADRLGAPLDVAIVRKLRHPASREYAIGAIDESGEVTIPHPDALLGVSHELFEEEKARQMALIRERRRRYRMARPDLDGRAVILVDDGVATGSTLMAALKWVRRQGAVKVVVAIGVGPRSTIATMAELADEVVCPMTPANFEAVGQFYMDFGEVSDEEVMAILGAG